MKTMILLAALLSGPSLAAERHSLKDAGDFAPAGHRVEFADRYGWRSYKAEFDFTLDDSGRALTKDSKLWIKIERRDGSAWTYTCRAKGRDAMTANVNYLIGRGVSIVAECRVPEAVFAKALDLHPSDVGFPNLVFQALIQDGKVRPGAQRGVHFVQGGQIESSDLNAYASNAADGLAVVFRSN